MHPGDYTVAPIAGPERCMADGCGRAVRWVVKWPAPTLLGGFCAGRHRRHLMCTRCAVTSSFISAREMQENPD